MVRYLIRRFLWAIALFVVVTMVTYVIFFIIPADPAKLACGQRATLSASAPRRSISASTTRLPAVRPLPGGSRTTTTSAARSSTRQSVNETVLKAAPGDGVARDRRRGAVAAALCSAGHPLGAEAALAARPHRDGLRPDRPLGAPRLDRTDLLVRHRLPPWLDADHGLLRLRQPVDGLWRPCSGRTTWSCRGRPSRSCSRRSTSG